MLQSVGGHSMDTGKVSLDDLNWVVYMHTNLTNGKVYIGITHDICKRWRGSGCAYKSNRHFWNAIQKYGWDGFRHEVLYEGLSHSEACACEIKLISEYNACNRTFGYNKSSGGENPLVVYRGEKHHFFGKTFSEEHRKRLSESHKGEKHYCYGKHLPEETRRKISEAQKGKKISEEQKALLRKASLGRKQSEETIKKRVRSLRGHPVSEETRQRIRKTKVSKRIYQLSHSGELLCEWPSVTAASNASGLDRSQIRKCCKGELKTTGGFAWAYADEVNNVDMLRISEEKRQRLIEEGIRIGNAKQRKCVMQLTSEGVLVQVWPSLTEAAKSNGMSIAAICHCCKGITRTSGGYNWRYVDMKDLDSLNCTAPHSNL